MQTEKTDVIIIGAGMAGLTAASILKAAGRTVRVIEAAAEVGGRVRTDNINGFLLDHGFQVLLTAYPEAKALLDYKALNLQYFDPGALLLNESGKHVIGDPLRKPATLFSTITSPAGTFADKMRLLLLNLRLRGTSTDEIFNQPETSTIAYLKDKGFTDKMLNAFFKPFMSGIFLENQLQTSSRMFEFVFKMFGEGNAAVPALGMGMIPCQLASKLTTRELVLNETVVTIDGYKVHTSTGTTYMGQQILIATNALDIPTPYQTAKTAHHEALTIYFAADKAPFKNKLIALNAMTSNVLVNNIAVMNNIAPAYAPESKNLIGLSVIGKNPAGNDEQLAGLIKQELSKWFAEAAQWQHVKTYHIKYALPNDDVVTNHAQPATLKLTDNCFICGDHLLNGSINAAMKTGRLAAEAILAS